MAYGFDYLMANDLNLDFLICEYYDFNTQSKRVQEKCGFKPFLIGNSTVLCNLYKINIIFIFLL